MKQQGYSNNQIIQALQRDGYNSSQIFDAISQAEMNMQQNEGNMQMNMQMNPQTQMLGQQLPPMNSMNQMSGAPINQPFMQQMPMPTMSMGSSSEELIEAIIDEKWNELIKDINKVIEWKQKADAKLAAMEQQLGDMQGQFDKLHTALLGKVNDYDKHILEVGTQLQAMEKVFGKVLPTFIDNVNELDAITRRVKSESKEKTEQKEKKTVKKVDKL
jgi:hypothetical protein